MNKKVFVSITFLNLLLFIMSWSLSYAYNPEFVTTDFEHGDQEQIYKNLKLSITYNPEKKSTINSFSVNQNNDIAVGFSNNTINIYSSNGDFKYGYIFESYGDYIVDWKSNNVLLILVRGNISVELDESGEFVEVKQILNTIENDKLMDKLIRKGHDNVNGYQYILTNDFGIIGRFAPNDSKLVQITPEGEKCILYDVSKRYHTTLIFLIILVLLIVSIVFIGFIRMFIRIARDPHFGES